jgi:hypothetical protein
MHENLIKRTIWVSKCPKCGDSVEKDEKAPRERLCMPCHEWVPYIEQSYIGKDFNKGNDNGKEKTTKNI